MDFLHPFAKYRDIFGEPRTGIHARRIPIIDLAFWDTIQTLVLAVSIAFVFKLSIWKSVVAVFALGLAAHVAFGVKTKMTTTLGLS